MSTPLSRTEIAIIGCFEKTTARTRTQLLHNIYSREIEHAIRSLMKRGAITAKVIHDQQQITLENGWKRAAQLQLKAEASQPSTVQQLSREVIDLKNKLAEAERELAYYKLEKAA